MATNAADDPDSLVCGLCEKTYQYKDGPLMLPCLHSFCKPCLDQHIKKERSTVTKKACPTCNVHFPNANDVTHFPLNLYLSRLAESREYEKQAESGNVKCQNCEGKQNDATYFFCSYSKFLCSTCKGNCQRLLNNENSEFIDLASYKKGELKIHSPPPKCQEHQEKLNLFCQDCTKLICVCCSQTEHQHHEKSSLTKVCSKKRSELENAIDIVDIMLKEMDGALQQIQQMRNKVKVSAEEATARVNRACDDLIQAVEIRRKVLLGKCQEIAEGKEHVLSNQTLGIECLRKDLDFARLHAKGAINNYSPEEFLSVEKAIQHQLVHKMEVYRQQSMNLRENDIINTSLLTKPLIWEIQKLGSFPGVPDPSNCHVKGLAVPQASLGKERMVTVVLNDEMGKPVEDATCFQYQLGRVGNNPNECIPSKINVIPSKKNEGEATLIFSLDQPGEYQLTIMVRNRPIANPYQITARESRDYKNFQKMKVTYKNVGGKCYGVTVHDNGTVYATNYKDHTIKVFKLDGTVRQIGGPDNAAGGLSCPLGITILDNTLYVVSNSKHMVKKYSIAGRFIGEFGGNGTGNGQFNYPQGICTDERRRILVADQCNSRIQVFTSEGIFISSIKCSSRPCDVATDPVGNIHVALYDNNHIAVFSQDGRQIKTYNLGGKLKNPTGIYIDGEGNRLIGAGNSNQVHIADPTGGLISTRQVNGGWGVTMDKNGAIYVAERHNNRVSMHVHSTD